MDIGDIRYNLTQDEWVITSIYQSENGEMFLALTFFDKDTSNIGTKLVTLEDTTEEVKQELLELEKEYPIAIPLRKIQVIL